MRRKRSLLNSIALLAFTLTLPAVARAQQLDEGIRLYNQGKFKDAEKILRALSEQQTGNPDVHYYLALTFLAEGNILDADAQIQKAAEENLPSDMLKVGQARVELKKGNIDQGIALLNEAQEENPDNAQAYEFRGIARAGKQEFAAAAADLEKAIQLDPSNAQSHYYAGMVYSRLGKTDKMVEEYRTFLKLAPNSQEAPAVQSFLRSVR